MKINIGFFGALMLLLIALKLTHYIGWSWWIILLPLWVVGGLAISVGLVILLYVIANVI